MRRRIKRRGNFEKTKVKEKKKKGKTRWRRGGRGEKSRASSAACFSAGFLDFVGFPFSWTRTRERERQKGIRRCTHFVSVSAMATDLFLSLGLDALRTTSRRSRRKGPRGTTPAYGFNSTDFASACALLTPPLLLRAICVGARDRVCSLLRRRTLLQNPRVPASFEMTPPARRIRPPSCRRAISNFVRRNSTLRLFSPFLFVGFSQDVGRRIFDR